MKIQNSIKAACAVLLLGLASQAGATVIAVNGPSVPKYLNNETYNGSFDASALLPQQFTINSIGFSFTFADDATDPFTSVTGTTTSSSSGAVYDNGSKTITTTITKTTPVTKTGAQESVLLSFGSATFGGQTSAGQPATVTVPTNSTKEQGTSIYTKNGVACTQEEIDHDKSCKLTASYTVTDYKTATTTTDYTGTFALAQSLLSYDALLAALIQNKSLNFSLGVTGDLYLTGATLNIDYTDTTPPAPVNDVPEPASLALFGIALAGIAGVRRARRG